MLSGIKKIAVLRANALGDFIFVLPALQALRQTYLHAEIVYLGTKLHYELLKERPGPIDRVEIVPSYPGVGASEGHMPDVDEVNAFINRMQAERFDIALQLHGGGGNSNPFLLRLGAKLNVGLCAQGAQPLDISVPYIIHFSEVLRYLEVVARIGAVPVSLAPTFEVTRRDVEEAMNAIEGSLDHNYAVIHPSATDARRHWPVESFAAVADYLIEQGLTVYINGVASEREIGNQVIANMDNHSGVVNLAGQLSLCGLVGLLSQAAVVISNDSGPLHVAHALNVPSVGIYWVGNMITGTPMTVTNTRPVISWTTQCPLCGEEPFQLKPSGNCDHDTSFVASINVEEVIEATQSLLNIKTAIDVRQSKHATLV